MRLTLRELQQIDAAVLAHGKWITQLRIARAVDTSAKGVEGTLTPCSTSTTRA